VAGTDFTVNFTGRRRVAAREKLPRSSRIALVGMAYGERTDEHGGHGERTTGAAAGRVGPVVRHPRPGLQRGARGRGGTGAVALADRVRPVRRCVGRGDVRGHGGGGLVPADGAPGGGRAGPWGRR